MTSIIAGPPPLNGICSTSIPAIIANSTDAVWVKLPTPACAKAYCLGLLFASAISSFTELAGTDG